MSAPAYPAGTRPRPRPGHTAATLIFVLRLPTIAIAARIGRPAQSDTFVEPRHGHRSHGGAGYWPIDLFESNFAEYAWRRLLTISAEDCWVTHEIEALYRAWKVIDGNKGRQGPDLPGQGRHPAGPGP